MELPVNIGGTTDNTLGPLGFAHSLSSLNLGINDPVTGGMLLPSLALRSKITVRRWKPSYRINYIIFDHRQ